LIGLRLASKLETTQVRLGRRLAHHVLECGEFIVMIASRISRPSNVLRGLAAGLAALLAGAAAVSAQTPALEALRTKMNANTVAMVTGSPSGTYIQFAHDMASVLDKPDGMRILAILGKGSVQNVKDILHLRGVDMGIVQSDVMRYFRETGELGRDIQRRLVYVTKLYNEEFHIVAGKDITKLADLAGKRVNFAEEGSGTQFSARIIFGLLNMKVTEVNVPQNDALDRVRTGDIAATVFVAGRPAAAIARLPKDPAYKLISVPYTREVENDYLPATLTAADYPNLISENQKLETIAVGAVLASFNWDRQSDRYRRVAAVTEALFANIAQFQKAPRHPKWKEVNLAAPLPGWSRFPAAEEWLAANRRGTGE
jgi:TRAP transporter TAXI family solute receptor